MNDTSNERFYFGMTTMQYTLFSQLRGKQDVPIVDLYATVYPQDDMFAAPRTPRTMQQKLAPLIQRVNAKLNVTKIVPGEARRTYRLIDKH